MTGSDYGQAGLFGIGTPQANPTVETELRILLPAAAAMAVARLTSRAPDPATRLRDYLERLEATLEQFDALKPDAFGFGCTASSYLVAREEEERIVGAAEARFGFPIITASAALCWHLRRIGVRRMALASPYPGWLSDAAATFWQSQGFDIAAVRTIETGSTDTRGIYDLRSDEAQPATAALSKLDVDAIVLSGTGMPSLRLIASAGDKPPLLSSNLCMAMRLCAAIGAPEPDPDTWRPRLALASPLSNERPEP